MESTLSRFLSITFLLVLGFPVEFLHLCPSSLRDAISARIRIPIDTWTAQGLETCDQTLIRWTTLDNSPDAGRGTFYRWSSSGWGWEVGELYSSLIWISSLQRNRSWQQVDILVYFEDEVLFLCIKNSISLFVDVRQTIFRIFSIRINE